MTNIISHFFKMVKKIISEILHIQQFNAWFHNFHQTAKTILSSTIKFRFPSDKVEAVNLLLQSTLQPLQLMYTCVFGDNPEGIWGFPHFL